VLSCRQSLPFRIGQPDGNNWGVKRVGCIEAMDATDFPITVDPAAVVQMRRILERKGEPGSFIRVGVKGGGCSGYEYVFKIETKQLEIDHEVEIDGVKIVLDSKSADFLNGAMLVYTGNLLGGGFAFENPNAAKSCGCGTSFTPKKK
jgi:iron-sulfur cluster assembly protein